MFSIGHIYASLRTDQGRVRDHNEDFIACKEPETAGEESRNGWLYVVADGVGGAEKGEVASEYATERTIHHYLADDQSVDWGERLRQAMQSANTELRQMVAELEPGNKMATTMVAAVFHDDQVTIANVGDSRAYHLHNGVLHQVTKDQSLVARLVEEGAITEKEALNHPRKNVILHSLGAEKTPLIDLFEIELELGDQIILCSDGLTRHVMDEEIASLVSQLSPSTATEKLIRLANERGGEDNISVAVLRIGEQQAELETKSTPTGATGHRAQQDDARMRRALWIYTAILVVVQVILIVLVWNIINSS
ncbi:MAG: Stp1/IreP family PP2C-type Ser/Thr phosphatase [Chloroflexota bacterium]|jgi:protein phosphatase